MFGLDSVPLLIFHLDCKFVSLSLDGYSSLNLIIQNIKSLLVDLTNPLVKRSLNNKAAINGQYIYEA